MGVPALSLGSSFSSSPCYPPQGDDSCRVGLTSCGLGQSLRPSSVRWPQTQCFCPALASAARGSCLTPGMSAAPRGAKAPRSSPPLLAVGDWYINSAASVALGSPTRSGVRAVSWGPRGSEPQMLTVSCWAIFHPCLVFSLMSGGSWGAPRRLLAFTSLTQDLPLGGPRNTTEDTTGCPAGRAVGSLSGVRCGELFPEPSLWPPLFRLRICSRREVRDTRPTLH